MDCIDGCCWGFFSGQCVFLFCWARIFCNFMYVSPRLPANFLPCPFFFGIMGGLPFARSHSPVTGRLDTKRHIHFDSIDFVKDINQITTLFIFTTYIRHPTRGIPNPRSLVCPTNSSREIWRLSNQNAPPNPSSVSTVQRALRATEALQPRTVVRDRLLHRPMRHRSGVLVSGTLAPLRRQLSHTLISCLRARFIRPGRIEKVVPEDGVGGEIVLRSS